MYYCAFKRGKTAATLSVWNNSLPLCWDVRKLWKQKTKESPWKRTTRWPCPVNSQEFLPNFYLWFTAVLLHTKQLPGGKISTGQWIPVSKWDPGKAAPWHALVQVKKDVQNPAVLQSTNLLYKMFNLAECILIHF